jgi:glycosyltransferase involved in cell wall biosynthesis
MNMVSQPYPLITVVIAVYNGVKTLQQCIDSVAQQTYANKELIIIDGGSNDGTVDLLEANRQQITYWISEPDRGICNAWNKGLTKAKGEWICFLGADDNFWNEQVLERMSVALQNIPPDVRLAYARIMLLGADGEGLFLAGEPWEKIRGRFMQGLCLPHQGVMHRRSLFEQNGKFDETFRIGGDYELMLRELKTAEAMFIPDIIVTAMRQGGLSSNPSSSIEAMRDVRRAQKMHGQYFPGIFWLRAMIRVYIRLLLWNSIGERATRKLLDFGRRIKGLPPYWTRT